MPHDSPRGGTGSLPQITRLPSFVKNGMVTSSNSPRVKARINFTTRQLAKLSSVRLNQQFEDMKNQDRPLNERLNPKISSLMFPREILHPEEGTNCESTDIVKDKLPLPVVPFFRPAYDPSKAERSRSFYLPRPSLDSSGEIDNSTDTGTWRDHVNARARPPTLPAVRFSVNDGPVFQTGVRADWPSKWFNLKNDNPLSPRRENTLGKIKVWKPTLDSILKSEAMKQHIIERAKTSLFLKQHKQKGDDKQS